MPITAEMQEKIDNDIAQVAYDRNTKLTIHQVMERFGRFVAQIEIDKEDLIRSKFDWTKQPYFAALSIYLYEVHAARAAAEGKGPGAKLREAMPRFKMNHKVLSLVLKFVIGKTNNQNLIKVYDKVKQDNNNLDTLHDILIMTVALRDFLDIAADFAPRGINVNEGYLDVITEEVEELLVINGETLTSGTDRGKLVDKQNKLIVLCLEAIDYIREYAEGAFCLDMDYFKEHYTINDFHRHKTTQEEEEETPETTEPPSAEETETTTIPEETEE